MSAPGATAALTREALVALAEQALAAARAAGADHADSVVESSRAFSVTVNQQRIDTLKHSVTHGLGLRVIVGGATGVVSTNDFDPDHLADLARRAVALARFSTPDEANAIPTRDQAEDGVPELPAGADPVGMFDPALLEWPAEARIAFAFELERIAHAIDPRVTRCDHVGVSAHDGQWVLANTHGVLRHERGASASTAVVALADDGGGKQQSGGFGVSRRRLVDLPTPDAVAGEAVRRALARIGARSVPSAKVPVIMHPDIAGAWLAELSGAFSGEAVMKRSSWLSERLGQVIASPLVTIVDDGRLRHGVGSSLYDGEGIRTRRNLLLDRGTCAMFAYDLYTARRVGARSTGNASRSYAGVPGIGYHNLFIPAGTDSPAEILKRVDRGFYMDDQGSFGFNGVTGDYSFQAQGSWIEHGERAFPVEGVTIASNSLDMLRNVAAVGNDLVFDGSVAAPTLLIAEMTLSGR